MFQRWERIFFFLILLKHFLVEIFEFLEMSYLASAIRAHNAPPLARFQAQIDILQERRRTARDGDVFQQQRGAASIADRPARRFVYLAAAGCICFIRNGGHGEGGVVRLLRSGKNGWLRKRK